MKKTNKKVNKKAIIAAGLLLGATVLGFAKEQEGVIVQRTDYPTETAVGIASMGQRIPSLRSVMAYLTFLDKEDSFLDTLLEKGVVIKYDDEYVFMAGKTLYLDSEGWLEIDGIPVTDMPRATPKMFPAAFAKLQAANRERGE